MPQICSQKKAEDVMVIDMVMVMVILKKANIMQVQQGSELLKCNNTQ